MNTTTQPASFTRRLAALNRGYAILWLAGIQVALAAGLMRGVPAWKTSLACGGWSTLCALARFLHLRSARAGERTHRGLTSDEEI